MIRRVWETWKSFGRFIGDLLARIVLSIFYFTIFLPFALAAKLFGNPLGNRKVKESLWEQREQHTDTLENAQRQT